MRFDLKRIIKHSLIILAWVLLPAVLWQSNVHAASAYCKYTYELKAISSDSEVSLESFSGAVLGDHRASLHSAEPAALAAEMRITACLQQGVCEKELTRLGSFSESGYIQERLQQSCDELIQKNRPQVSFVLRSTAKITLTGGRHKHSSGTWQQSQDHCLQGATLFTKEIIHTCELKTPPAPEPLITERQTPEPLAPEPLAPEPLASEPKVQMQSQPGPKSPPKRTSAPESDCAKQFALFQQDSEHAKHPICRLLEAKPACYRSYIIPELGGESAFRNACLNRYALCQRAYITQYDHDICALVKARKNCEQDFVYATDHNKKYDTELIDQFESTCQTLSIQVAEEKIAKKEEPIEEGIVEEEIIAEEIVEEEVIEEVVETKTIPQPTLCYASTSTLAQMNLKGMQVCENNNFQACQEVVKQKEDKLTLESKQNLNFGKLVGHYVCDDALENCQFAVEESSIGTIIYEFPACPEEESKEEIVEEIDEVIQEIIPEPGLICYASIPTLERMDVEGMFVCSGNNYTDCLQVIKQKSGRIFLGKDLDRVDLKKLAGKHLCDESIEACILITDESQTLALMSEKDKDKNKNNKNKDKQSFAAEDLLACEEELQRQEEIIEEEQKEELVEEVIEEEQKEEIVEELIDEEIYEPTICYATTLALERIKVEGLFVCNDHTFTDCLEVMDVESDRIFLGKNWKHMDIAELLGKYLCDEEVQECILVADFQNKNSKDAQNGPSISVNALNLSVDDTLLVTYSNAPSESWVGVYPSGHASNCDSFDFGSKGEDWFYTDKDLTHGKFDALSNGEYEVRLFDESSCFIGDPLTVTIGRGQGNNQNDSFDGVPACEEEVQRQEEIIEEQVGDCAVTLETVSGLNISGMQGCNIESELCNKIANHEGIYAALDTPWGQVQDNMNTWINNTRICGGSFGDCLYLVDLESNRLNQMPLCNDERLDEVGQNIPETTRERTPIYVEQRRCRPSHGICPIAWSPGIYACPPGTEVSTVRVLVGYE